MKKLRRRLAACTVVLAALIAAPSAGAHATLLQTDPGNDSVLQRSPSAVLLAFNEAVETAFGSVRVYDCNARRVDSGRISRPDEKSVAVAIGQPHARGTYTVTWRAISADSHPVSGAFVFHVGEPGSCRAGIAAQVLGKGTPGSVSALFKITRAVDFALLLLVVGGTTALALVLRSAAEELRRRLYWILAVLAAALVGAAIACILLQGAVAGGFGLGEALRWGTFTEVLHTRFGKAFLVQAVLAATVTFATSAVGRLRGAWALGALALVPAACLLPTLSAAGHARTSGTVAFAADLAHVAAASAWTGGLGFVVLGLLLAREDRWPLATRAVPRFSTLAVVSVAVLITAGVINGYEQVRAWRGLWETTYGLLLLTKVGLVLPLLALGAYNNRFAVPRLRRGIASLAERRRFLRAAGAELAIMVAVVGVTAVLVTEPPAKAAVAPKGPFARTVTLGPLELNLVVDPAKAGSNVIHLYLLTASGQPGSVSEAKVSASLPSKNLGPLRLRAIKVAPGHLTIQGATFPIAGDWQLRVEARRGEFEALTQTVSVPIRKG